MGIFWKLMIVLGVFIIAVPVTSLLAESILGFILAVLIILAFPIYIKFYHANFFGLENLDPYIPLVVFLFFSLQIMLSGQYEHETKDRKKDRRYKNNEWVEDHDEETREMQLGIFFSSLVALLIFGLLDYYIF
tara:strand:+ start:2529 stop:2927 length:399 start_codon:yes stop_codon:yes gene_type:complete